MNEDKKERNKCNNSPCLWIGRLNGRKKKVFLKYVSLSPGQIPLYPLLLERENFQLLAKHFFLEGLPSQHCLAIWASSTLCASQRAACLFFSGFIFADFIYFKVLSHTFHPENNSASECGYYYSSVDRWWKESNEPTLIEHYLLPSQKRSALCIFSHVTIRMTPFDGWRNWGLERFKGTWSSPACAESEVKIRSLWRLKPCVNDCSL